MTARADVDVARSSPVPRVRRPAPPSPPLGDAELQLAKIVLCHPELAPRVALLDAHIAHVELRRFVERVVDALVRFHDVPPRDALAKVPVAPRGQLVALADRVRLDGPDRTMGLATALSMVDAFARDLLERSVLEQRLGSLQPRLTDADARGDHDERKRLLAEQRALVATLQGLDAPSSRPLASSLARVVAALPSASAPLAVVPPPAELGSARATADVSVGAAGHGAPPSDHDDPAHAAAPPGASVANDDVPWPEDPDEWLG